MDVSIHSGYKDFVWAVELNRFALELVGLWPKNGAGNRFVSDLRLSVAIVTISILSLIPAIWSLIRVWGDIILVIDNLHITLSFFMYLLRLVSLRWKQTAVASILKMILEDWMESRTDAERKVMMRRAQTARLIIISECIALSIGYAIVIFLPPLGLPFRHCTNVSDRNKPLPLQAYYFYDTDKSPQFELTFFIQALTMFYGCVIYISVDAFLGLSVLHICGQLENFRNRLAGWVLRKDFDNILRKTVETHCRLIRFARDIEDAFSALMLGLVFYFSIVFCLFAFLFLAVINDDANSISFPRKCFGLLASTILLAHMLLYCFTGEFITEHCDAVYRAMCDLDWYELDPRRAKIFFLLTMRAKESFRLTAGQVVPLTLTTFCSLLKTSIGYISFLMAMKHEAR